MTLEEKAGLCSGRNFWFTKDVERLNVEGIMLSDGPNGLRKQATGGDHLGVSGSVAAVCFPTASALAAPFEGAVVNAKPWTVMCSYNKVNGVYSSQNPLYLTDVLRGEWGFDGYVVSDWGAVTDRVAGLKAGLELEMPSSRGTNDKRIVEAVKNGSLDEKVLDRAVERILTVHNRYLQNRTPDAKYDKEEDIIDQALIDEAVKVAKAAKVAVIFAGLPDIFESEGYDRT